MEDDKKLKGTASAKSKKLKADQAESFTPQNPFSPLVTNYTTPSISQNQHRKSHQAPSITTPNATENKIILDQENYIELMKDLYARTLSNPQKASFALITQREDGELAAYQYYPPYLQGKELVLESNYKTIIPEFRPISKIQETDETGCVRYECQSPQGTLYSGRTALLLDIHSAEYSQQRAELVSFIPCPKEKSIWRGSKTPSSIFAIPTTKEEKKDLINEFDEAGAHVKGGQALHIDPASVIKRKEIKSRKPDQNTVMKESAVEAYKQFLEEYGDSLSADVKKAIQESIAAPFRDLFWSQKRTEWLHLYGFGLTPQWLNPQIKENLGAAPKWANTEMMMSEHMLQWLSQYVHGKGIAGVSMSIEPHFEMILDTDIVKHIEFKTTIEYNNRSIQTLQSINPFASEPYRRRCDVAFSALVVSKILNGDQPDAEVSISKKSQAPAHQQSSFKGSENNEQFFESYLRMKTPYFDSQELQQHFDEQFAEAKLHATQRPLVLSSLSQGSSKDPSIKKDEVMKKQGKNEKSTKAVGSSSSADIRSSQPTNSPSISSVSSFSHGIIKVEVSGFEFDYRTPYRPPEQKKWTGSGFVITHNSEKIIITNAHVVDDGNHIRLFSMGKHKKYEAFVEYVCSEADLAVIKPKDPSFFDDIPSLKLSDKLYLDPGSEVSVKGYPIGGQELCETFGRVSRIEVESYVHRGQDLLQFQVDAAINSGNSGGPVFHNDEVIGVAFQGNGIGEALGYIIPNVILQHFLVDRLKDPVLRGFPELPIEYQVIENPIQKKVFGLEGALKDTGVLITKISPLFSGKGLLKKGDILININDKKINSDGTIDYAWRDHVDLSHEIKMMHLEEVAKLTVIRDKQQLDIAVPLKNRFADTLHVRPVRYNRKPTFLIESGLVFAPVSQNNIDEVEAELYKGASIEDSTMRSPDEEIVYISNVLISSATEGYESAERNIVKKINGIEVKNMPQLLKLLGSIPSGAVMEINLANDQILHIEKFNQEQTRKMCKRHDIHHLISNDLEDRNIEDYFLRDTVIPHYRHPTQFRTLFLTQGPQAALASELLSDSEEETPTLIDEMSSDESLDSSENEIEEESEVDSDVSNLIASEDDHEGYTLDPELKIHLGSIARRQASMLWGNKEPVTHNRKRLRFSDDEDSADFELEMPAVAPRTRSGFKK